MRHLRFTRDESIGVLCDRAAARFPDATITMDEPSVLAPERGTVLDYAGLAELVAEVSGSLRAAGVTFGDRIAVVKRNHFDIVVLAAAAARLGAVGALLAPTISSDDAAVMLGRLAPRAIVGDSAAIRAWRLDERDRSTTRVLVLDDGTEVGPWGVPYSSTLGSAAPPPRPVDFDAPMVITHTSGTTGVPKLVAHSARTMASRARAQTMPWPIASIRTRDRCAECISWTHARAIDGLTALLHVGPALLALGRSDIDSVRPHLEAFRPTIVETLPNVFVHWERLAEAAPHVFARTRLFVNAFDAIHPRTVRTLLAAAGTQVPLWVQAYGQSEAGGITIDAYTRRTVRASNGRAPTLRSMGFAPPGLGRIRVVDRKTGEPLPRGHVGQFEVASDGLALTYVGQPDLHARRRHGRWWTMGDVGRMTRTGRAILHDRDIDLVPGIDSCLELEDRLLDALPETTEVVIVAVDGRALPVVCTHGDRPLDLAAWRRAAGDAGPLEPPVHLPWDDVPRTATYKVRRSVLVDALRARRAVDRPAAAAAR